MRLPDRRLVLPVAVLALLPAAACGSSDGSGGSSGSGASDASSSSVSGDNAASGSSTVPKACDVLTPAMIEEYFHAKVAEGTSSSGYMGGSECDFAASEGGSVTVQTTDQPDTFFPDSMYAAADPVKVTAGGATRGAILLDNGSGTVYVVKAKVGVVVTAMFVSEKEDVTPATDADGQALAAELLGKL